MGKPERLEALGEKNVVFSKGLLTFDGLDQVPETDEEVEASFVRLYATSPFFVSVVVGLYRSIRGQGMGVLAAYMESLNVVARSGEGKEASRTIQESNTSIPSTLDELVPVLNLPLPKTDEEVEVRFMALFVRSSFASILKDLYNLYRRAHGMDVLSAYKASLTAVLDTEEKLPTKEEE